MVCGAQLRSPAFSVLCSLEDDPRGELSSGPWGTNAGRRGQHSDEDNPGGRCHLLGKGHLIQLLGGGDLRAGLCKRNKGLATNTADIMCMTGFFIVKSNVLCLFIF